MPYDIEELDLKNKTEEEQKRTRAIFEDLKNKVLKGEELSEHEKDFFCRGVRLSQLDDGKIEVKPTHIYRNMINIFSNVKYGEKI